MTRARLEALGMRVVQTSENDYQLQLLETVVDEKSGAEVTKPRAVKPTTRQVYDIYTCAAGVSDELAEMLTGMSKTLAEQESRHAEQLRAKNRELDMLAEECAVQQREYRESLDELHQEELASAKRDGWAKGWVEGASAQKEECTTALRVSAGVGGMMSSRALMQKAEDFDRAGVAQPPQGWDAVRDGGNPAQLELVEQSTTQGG